MSQLVNSITKNPSEPQPKTGFWRNRNPKRLAVIIFLSLLFSLGVFLALISLTTPHVSLASGNENVGVDNQIAIHFSRPVTSKKITAEISPHVNGAWEFPDLSFDNHFAKQMVFHPDGILKPNQSYTITLTGIQSFVGIKSATYTTNFQTAKLPTISGLSIKNNQTDVPICSPVNVNLSSDTNPLFGLSAVISPDVKMTFSQVSNQTYAIKFADCLQQGQNYSLAMGTYLYDSKNKQKIIYDNSQTTVTFKTIMPPQISSYSPTGSNILVTTSKFSLTFSSQMKEDYNTVNIKITPAIAGSWRWENNQTLSYFFSGKLAYGTNYLFEFPDRFNTTGAGYTDPDLKFQFKTIGAVQVSGVSPQNNSTQVSAGSGIQITFDQSIDQNSAESAFSISPTAAGKFSWSGNKMIFSPSSPLVKSTAYNINLTAPIKSINGLPMASNFAFHFTTEDNIDMLNIPVYYQARALSCEAAAAKMALNYKGANVSEDDIMNFVGYDPTVRNGNIWGDPYSAFVGSIDGHQNTTGYGVYWDPIARAASHFRQATAFSAGSAQKLATEISAGNPIVIWGTLGNATADSWQTPTGRTINGWKGEHARTVVGFKGSMASPVAFYLNDPVKGRIIWTTSELLANWGVFQNSGVVVY